MIGTVRYSLFKCADFRATHTCLYSVCYRKTAKSIHNVKPVRNNPSVCWVLGYIYTTQRFKPSSSPYCSQCNCVIVKQQYQYITCTGNLVYFPLSVGPTSQTKVRNTMCTETILTEHVFLLLLNVQPKTIKYIAVFAFCVNNDTHIWPSIPFSVVYSWCLRARRLKVTRICLRHHAYKDMLKCYMCPFTVYWRRNELEHRFWSAEGGVPHKHRSDSNQGTDFIGIFLSLISSLWAQNSKSKKVNLWRINLYTPMKVQMLIVYYKNLEFSQKQHCKYFPHCILCLLLILKFFGLYCWKLND